ncbi:UDP-glucose/GDP-mannose dehydrogenase family protein [Virgibacillus sp. MSP4-1]|uniref:UDP-glucose dehydrogenase family protein n=1 Tax=Virgibacillus sp. MSP4-1 TaxID=2700081 RepID=UPI0003A1DD77|nr:UDP-glucose/GDP-mannose dehydrogenase family protein [Virgibacillus sp. MSP4-1]QHS23528.1 UDP-glucose/GDP-mannose dehydrogenase family protein [Virgibacillus sp. MSP4-1]
MKVTVVGTGYVGLVTGAALAEIGHTVTCLDIDKDKVELLRSGKSPIYEPGLEELLQTNLKRRRLYFTYNEKKAYKQATIIIIAVGTPSRENGSANLSYIKDVAKTIGTYAVDDSIIVTKSTVPVGTNDYIDSLIKRFNNHRTNIEVVSNPEFLREGSAVHDTFHGDRMVIGSRTKWAAQVIEDMYKPLNIPIFKTDVRSAEMIKYAANAFLATKISFINEIANLCSKLDANINDVSTGMGLDHRIGEKFLKAGIGYGGSCFPKDTKALSQIAANLEHDFELLRSVIKVNNMQQRLLVDIAKSIFPSLRGVKIAILGLAFKPNTDDMREAPSIPIVNELINEGACIQAYDPVAINNANSVLPTQVQYVYRLEDALQGTHCAMIVTDWDEFKTMDLDLFPDKMATPIVLDGRNCFSLEAIEGIDMDYHSIGRPSIIGRNQKRRETIKW